ncbi:MAG: hypothetical protein V1875_05425 [Candidatus Altiarchaeota archaeon]
MVIVGRKCEYCGDAMGDVLVEIGNHLLLCGKAPFRDIDDDMLRRNAVQSHILRSLLRK